MKLKGKLVELESIILCEITKTWKDKQCFFYLIGKG